MKVPGIIFQQLAWKFTVTGLLNNLKSTFIPFVFNRLIDAALQEFLNRKGILAL